MKKNYSSTFHLPIVSVANEVVVANPSRFIVDWSDFHIAALWVKVSLTHKKIVLWQDIQEISNAWYIQSEAAFSDADELVRMQDLLDTSFNIIGAVCKTLSGEPVGKISDFTFDSTTGQITQLMVKNYLMKTIANELLLPVSIVRKVENKTIFIEDLDKDVPVESVTPIPLPVTNYV